jgi:methylenetetrahydrofolate reductase (NADPH)
MPSGGQNSAGGAPLIEGRKPMAFADALKSKDFVILAEMETPKGVDLSDFVENARRLKGRVDAVVIPDMSHAVMRLSAVAGAAVAKQQGLEAVVQFSCRDRNRLGLQGDLLAIHVLGINNVMAVSGEPVEMGDQLSAKPVYDLTPSQFLQAAVSLNQGKDMAGLELKGAPELLCGAKIEPWTSGPEMEVRLGEARAAVAAGASFLILPPLFDLEQIDAFLQGAGDINCPILASVLLLKSVGMARYLNQNLPGVNISEEDIVRIRRADDRPAECVSIAAEAVQALKSRCSGALILTAGWEHRLPEILAEAGA